MCPKCTSELKLGVARYCDNPFSKHLVHTACLNCRHQIYIAVPRITKQSVYLDQSMLSDLYANGSTLSISDFKSVDPRIRLVSKIREARITQKACFVISDIHAMETAGVPDVAKQKAIWEFANSLAGGQITGDGSDAFIEEVQAFFGREFGPIPPPDKKHFLNVAVNEWELFSPVMLTNAWRLRIHADRVASRTNMQANFLRIIESQDQASAHCRSVGDCVQYVSQLCIDDVLRGISHLQRVAVYFKEIGDWGRAQVPNLAPMPTMSGSPAANGYSQLLQICVDRDQRESCLNILEREVKSNGLNVFPSLRLAAAFEGELLWTWKQGHRRNPKRFNENFGVSRNMDVSHVSTYAPRVDALTTDRDMFNMCQRPTIQSELRKHACMLFSTVRLSDFEDWLDKVIAEPESEEFRLTRRLLCACNAAEREAEDKKFTEAVWAKFLEMKAQAEKKQS